VILLAHQGTATEHTGNTLDAFGWAVGHGATWIETDVWRSADGHLVCIHDGTIDRTTNGRGSVAAHDAGALSGYGVPSLADAVDALPGVRWNVDLKEHTPAMVSAMARFVAERGLEDRFRVASFSGRTIRAFRRLAGPRVRTAAASDEVAAFWVASRAARALPRRAYDALQVPVDVAVPRTRRRLRVIDARLLKASRRAGIEVHAWTVDAPDAAQRLDGLGVDGIITNRIDLLGPAFAGREE